MRNLSFPLMKSSVMNSRMEFRKQIIISSPTADTDNILDIKICGMNKFTARWKRKTEIPCSYLRKVCPLKSLAYGSKNLILAWD